MFGCRRIPLSQIISLAARYFNVHWSQLSSQFLSAACLMLLHPISFLRYQTYRRLLSRCVLLHWIAPRLPNCCLHYYVTLRERMGHSSVMSESDWHTDCRNDCYSHTGVSTSYCSLIISALCSRAVWVMVRRQQWCPCWLGDYCRE